MTRGKSTSVRGSQRSNREEGSLSHERESVHVSVMAKEVVETLQPHSGEVVVDATYGAGGHSKALRAAAKIKLIAIDADPAALRQSSGRSLNVIEGNFGDLKKILRKLGVSEVSKVVFDLGWNRDQLGSGRGFSFMYDEPLNMSYGKKPRSGFTAAEILNTWSEETIANVLFGYGEERYARKIATRIVERRSVQPFATTFELVELVRDAVPPKYRRGKTNPATKTFQALRIAVNDELGVLEQGLQSAWECLSCGGRVAVITFHSIEDRLVKRAFAAFAKAGEGKLVLKKPLVPTAAEIAKNRASRSAKLRAIEKICTH